jgi:hypothetical protein
MTRAHRVTTGALIMCLVSPHMSGTLFAAAEDIPSKEVPSTSVITPTSATVTVTSAAPTVSIPPQPTDATDPSSVPPSTLQRSRFTFSDEELAVYATFGADRARAWRDTFNFIPIQSTSLAQRGGYRGRRSGGGGGGAAVAIIIGAAATIGGTAVLVYANRPECSMNLRADGCGYGTKVVGGAVLAGGLVGLLVGAATWR